MAFSSPSNRPGSNSCDGLVRQAGERELRVRVEPAFARNRLKKAAEAAPSKQWS